MRRPLTVRERLAIHINQAASEALRAPSMLRIPTHLRGYDRWACPDAVCYGCVCKQPHYFYLTNHER